MNITIFIKIQSKFLLINQNISFSAVVEVTGQMGVHSRFVDTGVFVNSSVFTSQMMKGSVVYKEGKTFKLNIDAPEEPIEIFNVS